MTLDQDSYKLITMVWLVLALLGFIVLKTVNLRPLAWFLVLVLAVFGCFVTWFHRVPDRNVVADPSAVTSVADGKVVIVQKAYEGEYLQRECIQVSVYMNFFDVHANFWPVDGEITYYKYHPGHYFLAFQPKASEKNEHSSTCIKSGKGEVFFKQIAGTFARRIVCYSTVGENEKKGQQCGIIKFGSRIDMFLPLDCDIKVKVGDKVRACESVIAVF